MTAMLFAFQATSDDGVTGRTVGGILLLVALLLLILTLVAWLWQRAARRSFTAGVERRARADIGGFLRAEGFGDAVQLRFELLDDLHPGGRPFGGSGGSGALAWRATARNLDLETGVVEAGEVKVRRLPFTVEGVTVRGPSGGYRTFVDWTHALTQVGRPPVTRRHAPSLPINDGANRPRRGATAQ